MTARVPGLGGPPEPPRMLRPRSERCAAPPATRRRPGRANGARTCAAACQADRLPGRPRARRRAAH